MCKHGQQRPDLAHRAMRCLILIFVLTISLAACSEKPDHIKTVGKYTLEDASGDEISYKDDIEPIFNSRCIACHSCYDAPCQLKLTAYEGVERGLTTERVYQHKSLREGKLSRLFFDAQSEQAWRDEGFHSVLESQTQESSSSSFSIMLATLDLKKQQQYGDVMYQDLAIDDAEKWQCKTNQTDYLEFAHDNPQMGMPYALPALPESDHNKIQRWIEQGAPRDSEVELSQAEQATVDRWEEWFNRPSNKAQLVSRYIYEHLFLASIYFGESPQGRVFQLVRSKTAPGTPIDVIATRRPYDHPGVERVYYRFRLNQETLVAKTHMPYKLDDEKYRDWTRWFYKADYTVASLPSYDIKHASNPFKTFEALPPQARYRFMLDEANYTVKGFIKGPVCKGQAAVNVINEHFWVFFVDPDYQAGPQMRNYLAQAKSTLDLPAEKEDTLRLFTSWDEYAKKERAFLKLRRDYIRQNVNQDGYFDTDILWDGDGYNNNAALTVYRHFDNATVHKGLSGSNPKTAWVIDYPLLERIHYLLVAGYDVYGNISHNLLSRIYMDFLRMEGESLFLLMLPEAERVQIRQHWYRSADKRVEKYMSLTDLGGELKPAISDDDDEIKGKLFDKIKGKLADVLYPLYDITNPEYDYPQQVIDLAASLEQKQKSAFDYLPEVSLLELKQGEKRIYMSLLKHRGHLNNTSILFESLNIVTEETKVSLLPGIVGSRPNLFFSLRVDQLADFLNQIEHLNSKKAFRALLNQYVVSRRNEEFWSTYDRFDKAFSEFSPVDYGVLDLNKLQNH